MRCWSALTFHVLLSRSPRNTWQTSVRISLGGPCFSSSSPSSNFSGRSQTSSHTVPMGRSLSWVLGGEQPAPPHWRWVQAPPQCQMLTVSVRC